jgi:cell division protein ZapA
MTKNAKPLVKVSIFGTEYRVRGEADEEYIRKIAAYVDSTMKEIASDGRHISPTRIAVLAAFNIADELHRVHKVEGRSKEVEDRAARLLKLFEGEEPAKGGEAGDSS